MRLSKIQNIFLAVIITWQAQGLVPADYQGKILPTTGVSIKAGVELVEQNKLRDLSKINIRWYLDNKLLTQGIGLKQINFRATAAPTYSHYLRAAVQDEEEINAGVNIPIVSPKLIIKTPMPAAESISLGKNILQAIPYFFNVAGLKDLLFNWAVNEKTIKGTNILELELAAPIPQNNNLRVRVTAQNLNNQLEFASKEINLYVQQ